MTDAEIMESKREALRLMGDTVRRRGLKPLKTIHEKTAGGCRLAFVLFEEDGGRHVYGVEADGVLVCTGTKAEVKACYGRGR
jgi:hypothetical protein